GRLVRAFARRDHRPDVLRRHRRAWLRRRRACVRDVRHRQRVRARLCAIRPRRERQDRRRRALRGRRSRGRTGPLRGAAVRPGEPHGASWSIIMATKTLKLYIDYKSPYAYLAKDPAYDLARDTGVVIDWLPYTLDIPAYLGSARVDAEGRILEQ